ncbi:MAG: TonB family protein [Candidatus Obscuribacterales bacterium]|nr:TonB family protein [Candidatus Obscuribacterales bacterium]
MHTSKNELILTSAIALLSGTLYLSLFLAAPAYSSNGNEAARELNNAGVTALRKKEFETAIQKFEDALRASHGYTLAQENLAIAYNNYGIQEARTPKKCLKFFHRAAWLKPDNPTTIKNLDATIKNLGVNPSSFDDRVQLAKNAERENDFAGAIVEYRAALNIREDANVKKRLAEVRIPENWNQWLSGDNGNSTTSSHDADFGPYMADLQRRIKRAWYPPKGNETKRVVTIFKVHSDGSVSDIKLDKSSGSVAADKAAIIAIKEGSPYHTLPKNSPAVVDIQFTFDYNVFSGEENEKVTKSQLKKEIAKYLSEKNFKRAADSEVSLAELYVEQKKDAEAIDHYKAALKLLKKKVDDPDLKARASSGLADVYYAQKNYSSAQVLYQRCLDLRLKDGKDKNAIATTQRDLGYTTLYLDDKHVDEAQNLLQEALNNAKDVQSANDDTGIRELITNINCGIAHCLWQKKEYELALDQYTKVLNETKRLDGDNPTARITTRQRDIADCYFEMDKLPEALAAYREAVAIASKLKDADQEGVNEAKSRIELIRKKLEISGTSKGAASQKGSRTQIEDADQKKVNEAKSFNELIRKKLGIPDTQTETNNALSWLPYTLGAALLGLLITHLSKRRQDNSLDNAPRRDRDRN